MINALEQLAKQQKDGGSPIQSIETGFVKKQKRDRGGLEKFIKVIIIVLWTWAT